MTELYAKVFVRTSLDHASLIAAVSGAIDGRIEPFGVVRSDELEVDVRPNEDRDDARHDDFVCFPYAVDVVGFTVSEAEFVRLLGQVMSELHAKGMQLVVACDWESSLPRGGKLM